MTLPSRHPSPARMAGYPRGPEHLVLPASDPRPWQHRRQAGFFQNPISWRLSTRSFTTTATSSDTVAHPEPSAGNPATRHGRAWRSGLQPGADGVLQQRPQADRRPAGEPADGAVAGRSAAIFRRAASSASFLDDAAR